MIRRIAPRQQIRERGEAYGDHVRGHVPAIGEQCHGVEPVTGGDLQQHCQTSENHHRPCPPFRAALERAVIVWRLPLRVIAVRHTNS